MLTALRRQINPKRPALLIEGSINNHPDIPVGVGTNLKAVYLAGGAAHNQ